MHPTDGGSVAGFAEDLDCGNSWCPSPCSSPVLRDLARRVVAGYGSLADLMQGTEERLAGIDIDEHLPKARKQAPCWTATLRTRICRCLERHVRGLYQDHCKGLARGAQLFEHAEVALSRAVLAAAAPKTADGLGDPLKDMTDTFDALGETLQSYWSVERLTNVGPL